VRTRRGDLCHGHGRRALSSDAGRVGRGTDDHEIVVHDVAPVDAVTVGYESDALRDLLDPRLRGE